METVTDVRTEPVAATGTANTKQAKPFAARIWDTLISIKLAIWTIILLAVTSILGTVIEQNQPPEKYLQIYEDWAYNLMNRLNVFDMYHSWWFLLLLCVFTVNITCCTVDRLPRVIRGLRKPKLTLDGSMENALPLAERWKNRGTVSQWTETYKTALGRAFAASTVTEADGAVHLYAEKGVYSRFGAYATHAGIVVVFVGAIIGNVFGFKSYTNIPDGQEVSHLDTRANEHINLPFAVRNNRFWVETYPSGQPKTYASDLSVIENGREVLRKTITVNNPLRYKGVWFYQSSYGKEGGATARVTARRQDGTRLDLSLSPNAPVQIAGYGTVRGVNYAQDHQGMGPALELVVAKPGQPESSLWIVQGRPDMDRGRKDAVAFSFGGLAENTRMYTGLQVAKDPGVNVVWLGCLLLTAGMMVSFFVSHRRIWIRLSAGPHGKVDVTAAGSANRNRPAFEKAFAAIVSAVREDIAKTEKGNPA